MAMEAVISRIRQQESRREIRLSYHPDNTVAAHLYERLGFRPTGELQAGEIVVRLVGGIDRLGIQASAVTSGIPTAYPFERLAVVGAFEASTRNDNWLIKDERGHRYVLRRNLQHAHVPRIEFQVRFQQHLRHHGFPTAEVVETRSGDLFALDDDGVPWVLCPYVEGREYDFGRREQVLEAARRLAQFHMIAETFPGEAVVLEYQPPIRDWWVSAEENLQVLEEMFTGVAVQDELAYLREWWRWVLAEWPLVRLDALPVGWVYGDYHGRNMVFVGDELRGLFDFDDLERGPLVFDVARGVHMFGREARGSFRIRPEVARLFIEAYACGRALTQEECTALPVMVAMYFPPNACYHRYCQQRRGEDIEARLRWEVGIMRALRAEMARIGPLFAHT
jgi:Ser/Thr protein kinase RdoA (MazF antagonist)